jgi:hypothetical protein
MSSGGFCANLARDAAELAESLASIDERPDPPPRTRKRRGSALEPERVMLRAMRHRP